MVKDNGLTVDQLLARDRELECLESPLDESWQNMGLTEKIKQSINYERELRQYLKKNKKLITIAGNVGLGKTSITDIFSHCLEIEPIYELESAEDKIKDELLHQFLLDKPKYCFDLQQHLLSKRLSLRSRSYDKGVSCVEDRTPEEDPGMFHLLFHQHGYLTDAQLSQLRTEAVTAYTKAPKSDLMIVLQGSPELSRKRILNRGRPEELAAWPLSELKIMSQLYTNFPNLVPEYGLHQGPIIEFNLNELKIYDRIHNGYMFRKILDALKE